MHSYRMGETVNLNQLPPNAAPVDYSTRPYPNWGRILSTENLGFANYQALVGTRGNRVLVSAIYQLPVGRSRTFLNHMNAIGDAVLGGWEVSTVSLWETGPYLTPITSPAFDSANLNLVYTGAL